MAKSTSVIQLINQGLTRQAVADQLEIGIASVFRILKQHRKDNPAPAPSLTKPKIAHVNVSIRVENNSKYVRGKTESRQHIESLCFADYDMEKKGGGSPEYTLKIPYVTDEELGDTISKLKTKADSIADRYYGFTEMAVFEPATEKS